MLFTYPKPLVKATLVKRYKRFFADAVLDSGERVTAHCPNTGSMKTCGEPGDEIFLLFCPSPQRKLAYTWELTKSKAGFVGVNTSRPNQLGKLAVQNSRIKELCGYEEVLSEVKYDKDSRIDLLLQDPKRGKCYVEIKNSTLFENDAVFFPDAVTSRGLKHLKALENVVVAGHRAVMLFMVNRPEGCGFKVASHIDPAYGEGLRSASKHGVEVIAYRVIHSPEGLDLGESLPVDVN